jgi:transcriptional regulator with XRE-family HTH domain
MDGKRIGNFIKVKRHDLGFTQERLAAEIGVERFVIENWENGEIPKTQYLVAIANVLQTSVDELLKGLDEPVEEQETKEIAVQPTENEKVEDKQSKAEKGYYETLNDKIANTDYENYETVEPHASNGFSDGERKFGFVLCSIMIALVILINATNLITFLTRPRELTIENCKQFIEIDAVSQSSVNTAEYEIRLTRKKNTYDISNLSITVEVTFELMISVPYYEKTIKRQVSFSDSLLNDGETLTAHVSLPHVAYWDRGIKILSVSGGM